MCIEVIAESLLCGAAIIIFTRRHPNAFKRTEGVEDLKKGHHNNNNHHHKHVYHQD